LTVSVKNFENGSISDSIITVSADEVNHICQMKSKTALTLMVLSDEPLTIRVSSNWTQEIPGNIRNN